MLRFFFLKSSISFVNAADRIPAVKPCGGMLPFQQAECEVYMPFFRMWLALTVALGVAVLIGGMMKENCDVDC